MAARTKRLSRTKAAQGRRDEAIRWYRAALERKPDHRGAKANLAELLGDSDAETE
jgi:tetratricopeptide (TPR) repeat protein